MFRTCSKDEILMVFNKKNELIKSSLGKTLFVPFFHKYAYVGINFYQALLDRRALPCAGL